MTPAQCRAARALLGWTQEDLAKEAKGRTFRTVSDFELGKRLVAETVRDLEEALEEAGIVFDETDVFIMVGRKKR